jgi:hypothetical protein
LVNVVSFTITVGIGIVRVGTLCIFLGVG